MPIYLGLISLQFQNANYNVLLTKAIINVRILRKHWRIE